MKRLRCLFVFVTVMGIEMACFGQEATISNVAFSQGPSGLGTQVDIYYTLTGATVAHTVTAQFSKDGGLTYPFAVTTATGDIGPGVFPGSNRHIVWNVAADYPGETITNAAIRVIADRPAAAGP